MMNRNKMYDYLKETGMKSLFYRKGKGYYVKFVLNLYIKYSQIIINDMYIRDFYSISLCTNEIVVRDEMDKMKINIKYKDIEKFEVLFE